MRDPEESGAEAGEVIDTNRYKPVVTVWNRLTLH